MSYAVRHSWASRDGRAAWPSGRGALRCQLDAVDMAADEEELALAVGGDPVDPGAVDGDHDRGVLADGQRAVRPVLLERPVEEPDRDVGRVGHPEVSGVAGDLLDRDLRQRLHGDRDGPRREVAEVAGVVGERVGPGLRPALGEDRPVVLDEERAQPRVVLGAQPAERELVVVGVVVVVDRLQVRDVALEDRPRVRRGHRRATGHRVSGRHDCGRDGEAESTDGQDH